MGNLEFVFYPDEWKIFKIILWYNKGPQTKGKTSDLGIYTHTHTHTKSKWLSLRQILSVPIAPKIL